MPEHRPVYVLDASAVINLLGSKAPEFILQALDGKAVVAEPAWREVKYDPTRRLDIAAALASLAGPGLLEVAALSPQSATLFVDLLSAPGSDRLDDGEAATIAVAVEMGGVPVLDERRARRVYGARFQGLPLLCSVELFRMLEGNDPPEAIPLRELLFNALCNARMRVLPEHLDWVLGILGPELAGQCPSLPKRR